MTAMNHYLAQTRMHEARLSLNSSGGQSTYRLFEEIVQVVKGALTPISGNRAALGDSLSRDLGLR